MASTELVEPFEGFANYATIDAWGMYVTFHRGQSEIYWIRSFDTADGELVCGWPNYHTATDAGN